VEKLRTLLEDLPEGLYNQVFTHASWSERRSDNYSRLAFLGDSVLGLAVTTWLYPRLEAERFGAGRLTKIRAQAVSGPACREVAERLGVPERLTANAPDGVGHAAETLVETERVLASITEAIIGACYLHVGYEQTAEAVVERLARLGQIVEYEVSAEHGPPHERTFEVAAMVGGRQVGTGAGRSKKHAEQEAARVALEALHPTEESD
jgi:ribonuclease-3